MPQFQLFDAVKLTQSIELEDGVIAPSGTRGAVVEVLREGEAFLVELFGDWERQDAQGDFVPASAGQIGAFQRTLDVVMLAADQMVLVLPAVESVGPQAELLSIVDELPREMVTEIVDFAQFLRHKQRAQRERIAA